MYRCMDAHQERREGLQIEAVQAPLLHPTPRAYKLRGYLCANMRVCKNIQLVHITMEYAE